MFANRPRLCLCRAGFALPFFNLAPPASAPPPLELTYLESTLTSQPASVDSKPLTETLNPLDATLTQNPGGGGPVIVN